MLDRVNLVRELGQFAADTTLCETLCGRGDIKSYFEQYSANAPVIGVVWNRHII